jgi:hypothetical protein
LIGSLTVSPPVPAESPGLVSLLRHRKRETKTERIEQRQAGKPTTQGHTISEAA